jgi:hypothetical protein
MVLFPEYAGFEMASIENRQTKIPAYLDLFQRLSHQYQVYTRSTSKPLKKIELKSL